MVDSERRASGGGFSTSIELGSLPARPSSVYRRYGSANSSQERLLGSGVGEQNRDVLNGEMVGQNPETATREFLEDWNKKMMQGMYKMAAYSAAAGVELFATGFLASQSVFHGGVKGAPVSSSMAIFSGLVAGGFISLAGRELFLLKRQSGLRNVVSMA